MTALNITELTTGDIAGNGVFDVLLRSVKAHLDQQFTAGRIKGPEYATVYLGSVDLAMQTGMAFVLQQRKNDLEAQLLGKQLELVTQQIANLAAEGLNIPKQGALVDGQIVNLGSQNLQIVAGTSEITQKTANLVIQGELLTEQKESESLRNFVHPTDPALSGSVTKERDVLVAQECKLKAEFNFTGAQTVKSAQELALLTQKTATERAQIMTLGVDDDSVVGRQKQLYQAQTSGFARDSELKAAQALIATWNVRRTTDESTIPGQSPLGGVDNGLGDNNIARAVNKLLTGIGA